MECEGCGLTSGDLPEEVDPEFLFERGPDGVLRCQGCHADAAERWRWRP